MYSNYFNRKVRTNDFKNDLNEKLEVLKGKKVLLYGAGIGINYLKENYPLMDLDIVAIADLKFKEDGEFLGLKSIAPNTIPNYDFDMILITLEYAAPIEKYLGSIGVSNEKICSIFTEKYSNERNHLHYLDEIKFDKRVDKFAKKYANKNIVIYGAGLFFQTINYYYDLSKLNIIGISDKRFENHKENETFLGYKVCTPEEIKKLNPDVVLVGTINFISIIEYLAFNVLSDTKIKIKPLIKKPLLTLIREIWN